MKKLFSILLRIACIVCLAACGSGTNKPVEPVKPAESQEPVAEEVKFTRGTWNSDRTEFVNESTDLHIVLNDSFVALSDEELVQNYMNGEDVDLSSWTDNDYEEQLSIPDCAFINYYTGSNTGILYENLAAEKALSITEDMYINISTGRLKNTYTDMVPSDIYDITLCGENYRAIDLEYSTNNVNISQTMAVRKTGNYMTIIVFTTTNGNTDAFNEMIGFFK